MARVSRHALVALFLSLLFTGATLAWVMLDRTPPNWDDAWYLTNSLTVFDALGQGGVAGYLAKLNSVFGFKAPLIAALPTPFYLLLGRRWHAAYLVNIVSMLVLFAVLYRIAHRWWGPRAAVLAIAVSGTMPLLYGLARWYMVEYSMTALLAIAVCLLIESDELRRDGKVAWFGAAVGFGLLLKITFGLFALPMFAYFWMRSGWRVRPLLTAGLPCLVLAGPWYLGHLRATVSNALDAGFGAQSSLYGTGSIFSVGAISAYLSNVATNGISPYFLVIGNLLIVLLAFQRLNRPKASGPPGQAAVVMLAWVVPFLIFLFGGNKDVRFIAPILPAFALAMAFLLDAALPRTIAGTLAGALLLVFPILQMSAVSFGLPYRTAESGYTRHFRREIWPHDEMLNRIVTSSRIQPGERETLLVGADRAGVNANNLELVAVAKRLPFDIETTASEKSVGTLRQRLADASYFLYKDGGEPESPAFNPFVRELVDSVLHDPQYRELGLGIPVPDGGIVHIFKKIKSASGQPNGEPAPADSAAPRGPEEFEVDFGGIAALTAITVEQAKDEITVKLRWRCLRAPDRNYWSFTHLIDASGAIVAQRDHQLLGGAPPMMTWRPGDGGEETIRLALRPSNVSSQGMRLRIGLYDPLSGGRLHAGPLRGAAASRFSLTDRDTALLTPK